MLINKKLSQEIYNDAGEDRRIRAKSYLDQGKINIIKADYENQDNFSVARLIKVSTSMISTLVFSLLSKS